MLVHQTLCYLYPENVFILKLYPMKMDQYHLAEKVELSMSQLHISLL